MEWLRSFIKKRYTNKYLVYIIIFGLLSIIVSLLNLLIFKVDNIKYLVYFFNLCEYITIFLMIRKISIVRKEGKIRKDMDKYNL